VVDFDNAVLARSREVPVLVDFWAPWCGPCRILGPILDDLATAAGGRWELVKLNTDEQPDVAQAYGVMSIPSVKLFMDGRVTAEFMGALPKSEVQAWLERQLPDPRQGSLDALAAAWVEQGGTDSLIADLEAQVERYPDLPVARLRLAQALVASDPRRARQLVESVDVDADLLELSEDVTSLADLMDRRDETPPRLARYLEGAREGLRRHDLVRTFDCLVDVAMRDKEFGDQLARRACVALFRLLGHDHELTDTYQRRLSMALHN